MANDQSPTIFGDGTQSRDFTYVSNVVEGNILAATKRIKTPIVMNCATHGQVTINEFVKKINEKLNKNIEPIYTDKRPGEILHSFASIALIEKILDWKPKYFFDAGIESVVSLYLK